MARDTGGVVLYVVRVVYSRKSTREEYDVLGVARGGGMCFCGLSIHVHRVVVCGTIQRRYRVRLGVVLWGRDLRGLSYFLCMLAGYRLLYLVENGLGSVSSSL